jgi:hypothetical protein
MSSGKVTFGRSAGLRTDSKTGMRFSIHVSATTVSASAV